MLYNNEEGLAGMNKWLTEAIKTNKSLLLNSFIFASIFVLAAHAFCFLNLNLSHDFLNEFYALDAQGWKISIGRFLAPTINFIFGQFSALPWLSGIVTIVAISVSTYLIVKMFKLEKRWQIILLSGLLSTSPSITALAASFMQDLTTDMVALLLAVFAAYQWNKLSDKFDLKTSLICVLAIYSSLGCYQGYLSVMIVLIIAKSISSLLHSQPPAKVFKHGLIGITIVACSSILYFATANIVSSITGYQLAANTTNSLSNVWDSEQSLSFRLLSTYLYTFWGIFAPTFASIPEKSNLLTLTDSTTQIYTLSTINILILLFCAIITIRMLFSEHINKIAKASCLLLMLITPFAMNITHFLSGYSHILMHYAFILFYLFFIIFLTYSNDKFSSPIFKNFGKVLVVLSGIVVLINIELANALYVKKDLEKQSTASTITRVLSLVEAHKDYTPGKTKVCLIGNIQVQNGVKDALGLSTFFGSEYNSSVTYQATYNAYFNTVLQYRIIPCTASEIENIKNTEKFNRAEAFPHKNSILSIDDKIIVKMSN